MVIIGQQTLRSHLQKLVKVNSTECRACVEDDETLEHYFHKWPALCQLVRYISYGSQCSNLKDIGHLGLNRRDFTKYTELNDKAQLVTTL